LLSRSSYFFGLYSAARRCKITLIVVAVFLDYKNLITNKQILGFIEFEATHNDN